MFRKLKEKIVAGLLSCACACVVAGAGFGVGAFGVNADSANGAVGGGDNPSVTGVTAPFTQGSLGEEGFGNTSSVTQGVSGASGSQGMSGGDNPSVTGVTAPFTQGSLGEEGFGNTSSVTQNTEGDSILANAGVVSQDNSLARATALRMTESAEGTSGASGSEGVSGADGEVGVKGTEFEGYSLEIVSKNLSYSESVYIIYAVDAVGVELDKVQLLFWNEWQDDFTKGTEAYSRTKAFDREVKGVNCGVYYSAGFPAKEMNDLVYCRAYVEVDGVAVYSDVVKYSVVDYVYEMRAKHSLTEKQTKMFTEMLDYGAAAQDLLGYRTDAFANATYYTVTVENGTLEDGFAYGRYAKNAEVTLKADELGGGLTFSHWEDENGVNVGSTETQKVSVTANKTYTAIYCDEFVYELSSGKDYYTIMGYQGNGGAVTIPSTFMGLPVRAISVDTFAGNTNVQSVVIEEGIVTIGHRAFKGCTALTSVLVKSGVTTIGKQAFYGCSKLVSVTLPDTVSSIADEFTFYACPKLESITVDDDNVYYEDIDGNLYTKGGLTLIRYAVGKTATELVLPESVTEIAPSALRDSLNLTKVVLPKSVAKIGLYAFRNCPQLTIYAMADSAPEGWVADWNPNNRPVVWGYGQEPEIPEELEYSVGLAYALNDDGAGYTVTGLGDCTDTDLVIPATYNGLPVTSIGGSAFAYCSSLTSVEIPDSVTSIGYSAFEGCSSLTSVVIPDSVTSIGAGAFCECYYLSSVGIPDSVTSIGEWAFRDCSNLTSVVIPDSVTSIGDSAFFCCSSLTSVVIPDSVTSIGDSAFNGCTSLTSVVIPNGLTSLGGGMFANCWSLTSIEIPNSVTSFGHGVFYYCRSLTSIVIPKNVTSIGEQVFEGCSSLTIYCEATSKPSGWNSSWNNSNCPVVWGYGQEPEIPEEPEYSVGLAYALNDDGAGYTVTGLGDCTDTDLVIPATYNGLTVTAIGDSAFANLWDSLTSVVIPESVTSIGDFAFGSCVSLTSVIIPCSVKSIGNWAFCNCYALTTVTMLDGVTSIGESVFFDCRNLTTVVLPKSLMSISDQVFTNCNSLTSIEIPNSVTSIGVRVFSGCTALTSITVLNDNENYKDIDGNLYTKDERLIVSYAIGKTEKTFTVPNTVTSIGVGSFSTCINLTRVNMPVGLTSIGENAFASCRSLTSVEMPDSVTSIGSYAFYNCSNLTIYCEAREQPSGWDADWNAIDYSGNYVPVVWGYKPATPASAFEWTSDGESVTITGYAGEYADVVIPNYIDGLPVTMIGDSAFEYCNSLTSVVIPDSVTSIDNYAFEGCSSLTSVEIPDSVTSIGYYAFNGCSSLASVVIPDSVTSIGSGAFQSCSSLTSVVIGDSVTSIDSGAFMYCSSLTNIAVNENNTAYKDIDGNLYTKDGATLIQYAFGKTATEFVIPDSVTNIGDYTFWNCSSLTSVVIGDSVTSIGHGAFWNCSGLTSVVIPESVTSIGYEVFDYCSNLTIYCEATSKPSGWHQDWNYLSGATYWYNEIEPSLNSDGSGYKGNYWRYVDGLPTAWVWNPTVFEYEVFEPLNGSGVGTRLVKMKFEASGTAVVDAIATDYGADPTGATDSTNAIQDALNAVANLGGGTVFLPAGRYRVSSTVFVPNYVSIVGDWNMPSANNSDSSFEYGTVILAKPEALGLAAPQDSPLFTLGDTSGVVGLTFFYPEQNAESVKKYGFTIYANAPATATLRNLTFLNSAYGIGVSLKSYANELVNLENIYGTFLYNAISHNATSDVGFYNNINISTKYWKNASAIYACRSGSTLDSFVASNLVAMTLGDLDDQLISNVSIDGGYIGMSFVRGIRPDAGFWGVVYKANISCEIGVRAEYLNPVCGVVFVDSNVGIVQNDSDAGVVKMSNSVYQKQGSGKVMQEGGNVASTSLVTPLELAFPASERLFVANGLTAGGSVDNSAALQAVLDSVGTDGGIVVVPNGIYRLDSAVNVPKNVVLRSSQAVFSRSSSAQSNNNGVVFVSYVSGFGSGSVGSGAGSGSGVGDSVATFTLAENAGVVGVRIWHARNDFEMALDCLDNGNYPSDTSIRAVGAGAYAYNNESVGAFVGFDFSGCDNHILKSNYGLSYLNFIRAGGANGVITQCLTNPNFMSRTNLYNSFDGSLSNVATWQKITVNGEANDCFPVLRDQICRAYSKMVRLENASGEVAFNVFAFGHAGLFEMVDSTAVLVNTSLDYIPNDKFLYELSGGSCEVVGSLRVYGTSVCVNSGRLTAYGRIAFTQVKETAYDSDVEIEDKIQYVADGAKRLSLFDCDTLNSAFNVSLNSDTRFVMQGSGSWKFGRYGSETSVQGAFSAVDIRQFKNGYLHFFVYCDDISKMGNGQIEITSSGKCDVNEYNWNVEPYITKSGWNEVWLDLSVAGTTGGAADLSGINFLRIYISNSSANFYIDGIEVVTDEGVDGVDGSGEGEAFSEGLAYALNVDGAGYTVTGIGECTDTELVIPAMYNGLPVTAIGENAFYVCSQLTSLVIPDSVTSIGRQAFYSCGMKNLVIPDSVTSIGYGAFQSCSSLTGVVIGDSVTSIGDYAFNGCSSLMSVVISDSVTSIGRRAFNACSSLTRITVNENNTTYKDIDGDLYTKDGATLIQYAIGKQASELVVPDTVTVIGESAFAHCSSLTSIVIPDSVTSIRLEAFYYCTNLINLEMGGNVTEIGDLAFDHCYSLVDVVIPETIVSMGACVFSQCRSLKRLVIPNCVTSIASGDFYDCRSLISVVIPESVTSIGDGAFYNCGKLEKVIITDNVQSVGENVFLYCFNLTIYCEASEQPSGWSSSWNNSNCPVVWGHIAGTEINVGGTSFNDAILADVGDYSVTIDEAGEWVYYQFTATESREYCFYSYNDGYCDSYGYLYDWNQNEIAYDDDGYGNGGFYMSAWMNEGETYYIAVRLYSTDSTGAFTLVIS